MESFYEIVCCIRVVVVLKSRETQGNRFALIVAYDHAYVTRGTSF